MVGTMCHVPSSWQLGSPGLQDVVAPRAGHTKVGNDLAIVVQILRLPSHFTAPAVTQMVQSAGWPELGSPEVAGSGDPCGRVHLRKRRLL